MASFEYEPYFPPENSDQEEIISVNRDLYHLTHENTRLKKFDSGNGKYDNLIHIYGIKEKNQPAIVIFLDAIGESDPDLVDRLIDKDFPVINACELDEITIEAYSSWMAREL